MKMFMAMTTVVAAYETEWAEFQAVQGARNGEIPQAFKNFVDFVHEHNAKESTYKVSYTGPHADKTPEEYKAILGFKADATRDLPKVGVHVHSGKPAVSSIDWTTKGAVTPVKNQGQCGSCWAFSSTGGTEGQWEIATGQLTSMSEQQLVDCSKQNSGCNGGLMDYAFAFYEKTSVATEQSYPYTGRDGSCKSSYTTAIPQGGVTGYKDISSETDLLDAVTNTGPISVAIEADQQSFQGYSSGVLTGNCGTNLDHGVLAVGFGTESGTDYWKVKNSWGASWGMNGYVLIQRGVDKCGIAQGPPSYPVVSGGGPTPPTPPPAPTPPKPPPAPTPPTPTPTPGQTHYGAPPCMDDEMADDFEDETGTVLGKICAANCDTGSCPSDTPGGTAIPQCALEDEDTGKQYCGLLCGMFGDCPSGSECSDPSAFGVCYWPSTGMSTTGHKLHLNKQMLPQVTV